MARIDVVMPQMGESIAEGTMSRWLKKVGDAVKRDEPIFEISTDKVDAEIPSPTSGVLAEVLVTEGQTVPVQTVVARIETEAGAVVAPPAGAGTAPAAAAPAPALGGGPPPKTESTPPTAPVPHQTPAVAPAALQPTSRPATGNGGSPGTAMRNITGAPSIYGALDPNDVKDPANRQALLDMLSQANGKPTVAATPKKVKSGRVVGNHAYTVLGTGKDSAGRDVVKLRNPWGGGTGKRGTFEMPLEQFAEDFDSTWQSNP